MVMYCNLEPVSTVRVKGSWQGPGKVTLRRVYLLTGPTGRVNGNHREAIMYWSD